MAKIVIYRSNDVFRKFLTPVLQNKVGIEVMEYPAGVFEEQIEADMKRHIERLRGVEGIYVDITCATALQNILGDDLYRGGYKFCWPQIDYRFSEVARKTLAKATPDETIAHIMCLMVKKEKPAQVFISREHISDHDMFGKWSSDDCFTDLARMSDALHLKEVIDNATGIPTILLPCVSARIPEGSWVVYDRHEKIGYVPHGVRQIKVPVENLVTCAIDMGIDLSECTQAFTDMVETW